jgi:hypothetical protein
MERGSRNHARPFHSGKIGSVIVRPSVAGYIVRFRHMFLSDRRHPSSRQVAVNGHSSPDRTFLDRAVYFKPSLHTHGSREKYEGRRSLTGKNDSFINSKPEPITASSIPGQERAMLPNLSKLHLACIPGHLDIA